MKRVLKYTKQRSEVFGKTIVASLLVCCLSIIGNDCFGQLPELQGVSDIFSPSNTTPSSDKSSENSSDSSTSKSTGNAKGNKRSDSETKSASKKVIEKKSGKPIELQRDLKAAQQLATLEGRPLLAVFGADWCTWCRKLELELQEDQAESILKSWVVVRIDADEAIELAQTMNVSALPAMRILDFQLNQVAGREGYLPVDELEEWLDEKYASANPAVQQVLFGVGPISDDDLKQLIELLADRSPKIRAAAVQRILPNRRQSAESIVDLVQSGKLAQKLAAIQILGSWKAPVDLIDPWVPETISEERQDKLKVWLSELLAREPDPNNSADSSARGDEDNSTGAIPIDPKEAREIIAKFLREPAGGSLVTSLTNIDQLPPFIREMLQAENLSDSDRLKLRELYYQALASKNTRLSEQSLLVGLASLNADTHRKAAEKILGILYKSDLTLIDELSGDLDPLVREMSIPVLDKIKALSEKDRLTRLLQDKSPSVRTAVLRALSENANTEAVDVLVNYTSSESDEDLLVFAAKTLGKMKLKKTRDAMSSLLRHSSWRIRAAALDAIGESLEKRSSYQSSGDSGLSDEIVDGVLGALDDSDSFVVSRAQTLLPKIIDGKNAERIVGSLIRNPKLLNYWLEGDFYRQSGNSKDLSKAAVKLLNSAEENERLGAVRLLAKVDPVELKVAMPTLLEQSIPIQIASLEGAAAMMARLRDQALQPHREYYGNRSTSAHLLPKLQFKPWFEIPESLKSIPKESKKASSATSPAIVVTNPKVGAETTQAKDDLDQVVDLFFSPQSDSAGSSAAPDIPINTEPKVAVDASSELPSVINPSVESSLDSLDSFFGSAPLPEKSTSVASSPQPSEKDVTDTGTDPSSTNSSSIDDLFGTPENSSSDGFEGSRPSTSDRDRGENKKDPSVGLPSHWLENYRKNGPKVFGYNPNQYDAPTLTDKEIRLLESVREKIDQQLLREPNGLPAKGTPSDQAEVAVKPVTDDVQTWLEVAALALGDPTRSESLMKKLKLEAIVEGVDEQSKVAFRQFELALSWMPGEQRLAILQSLTLNWRKLTDQQKSVLQQATVFNYLPIADWLLQEAQKNEDSDDALTEIQLILARSLYGQLVDMHSWQYFGSDWEENSLNPNPPGYKLSIDWMEKNFHSTQSNAVRSMLLSTLSFVDFDLAKQTAVGYLSQATLDEGILTQVALALSLSDKPEFAADRAAQWLGHPVKSVREASIRQLTLTAYEFNKTLPSEIKTKVKSHYLRDDHNIQPGFTFLRREIAIDPIRAFAADDSSKLVFKYRTLLFLIDPQASVKDCFDDRDQLTSQALIAAAIVKSNRSGEEIEQFFVGAQKDFLNLESELDEPKASSPLRMFFWSLSKMRGAQYVSLRNELRKKFPALSE